MGIGGQARPKWFNKRGPIEEVVQNRPRGMRHKSCLLWEDVIFDWAISVDNYCQFHHPYSLTRTLKTRFDLNKSLILKYFSCLRWVITNFNDKVFFTATLLSFERLDKIKTMVQLQVPTLTLSKNNIAFIRTKRGVVYF